MKLRRHSKTILLLACFAWLGAVGYGLRFVWAYENTTGQDGIAPPTWPTESAIKRKNGLPTLVVFIHPHCPCSRATIGELAVLMAHSQGLVEAHAVFVKPAVIDGWERTDLWTTASEIPSVTVSVDDNGVEAKRFRSKTSGQTMLYSATGQLLFSGGITASRGHSGDNDGRAALQSIVRADKATTNESPVFGCPLGNEAANKESEEFCDALRAN